VNCRNTDKWDYILQIGPNSGIRRRHRYNSEIPSTIKGGLHITGKSSWRNRLKDKRGKNKVPDYESEYKQKSTEALSNWKF
jgi:hypothetical protein